MPCKLVANVLPDFAVYSAAGVTDGWRLYNETKYSLVIVDYRLSDGNGIELCERIRSQDYLTPVIFITGDPKLTESDVRIAGGQRLIRKGTPTFVDELYASAKGLSVSTR